MRPFSWSRWWQRSSTRPTSRPRPSFRPRLEVLETRQLLTAYTVVLATDTGGPSGTRVTATTGDLRYCVQQADANTTSTSNTIGFSSTVFANPQTITLNSADGPLVLDPSKPLTIQGLSTDTVALSGGDATQVFDITSGTVTIRHLAITQGVNSASGFGGGISNSGTLTLIACTLDHDSDSAGSGGGLANLGTATVTNCTFNLDSAGDGGGIYSSGPGATLTMSGTNISNCTSSATGGGGLFVSGNGGQDTVTKCTFSNDSCNGDGGGVFVEVGISVTFTSCTLSNDSAGNGGGGLCTDGAATVTMNTCTMSNDLADQGAGLCNSGGTVTLTSCTLANDAIFAGFAGSGGGMLNQGTATLTGCTFNNDQSIGGGGLFNEGQATATNCTFCNNTASGNTASGGAIYNVLQGATLTLTNCTVAYNAAAANGTGGGILNQSGATLNLLNTIVAENTAGSNPDVSGVINTADHDLIGDGTGSSIITDEGGNLIGGNGGPVIDPRLGPLQSNGGPTQTLALYRTSPAIGHADNAVAPATDQRGVTRIDESGETTDIGAYEYP